MGALPFVLLAAAIFLAALALLALRPLRLAVPFLARIAANNHSEGRNSISCSSVFCWMRNARSNSGAPLVAGAFTPYFRRACPVLAVTEKYTSSASSVTAVLQWKASTTGG